MIIAINPTVQKSFRDIQAAFEKEGAQAIANAIKNGDIVEGIAREGVFPVNVLLYVLSRDIESVKMILNGRVDYSTAHDALLWNAEFGSATEEAATRLLDSHSFGQDEALEKLAARPDGSVEFARALLKDSVYRTTKLRAIKRAIKSGNAELLDLVSSDIERPSLNESLQIEFRNATKSMKLKQIDAEVVRVLRQHGFPVGAPL